MPGKTKQVRFAYKNTYHSPAAPPPPALYFSSSTATSSSGPITPPSSMRVIPGPSPYLPSHTIPSYSKIYEPSSKFSGRIQPHPYLDMSALTWDVMDHQSTATRHHHSLPSQAWREPATNPPVGFLSITSPYLPWTIKVLPSKGSFVTFEDVLSSIYRTLRTNISSSEFNLFPSSNDQRRATRAYEQRYRRQRSARIYDEEKRGGMKRVDFLMGHTRFLGISNVGRRPDEWQLNIT
ncbi:hypothetical protein GALMADRAFT_255890 [Galerina marginata CBS 339.88]|uniref:DUF6699 domain-containing protein n=1 Tax=Galerina marginata (strain CBS 339.88) TaxID=685588 RepID=A0A067SES3_GALM3|nr:hypothetical protein GALMADRAFT_255890 [Galerina marginata CBS 339.88]